MAETATRVAAARFVVLPGAILGLVAGHLDARDLVHIHDTARSLRAFARRHVELAKCISIPSFDAEKPPPGLAALLGGARALTRIRCGHPSDRWAHEALTRLVARLVRTNSATIERVDLPCDDPCSEFVHSHALANAELMAAIAACPRLSSWWMAREADGTTVATMAATCTRVARLGFGHRRDLEAFMHLAPGIRAVSSLSLNFCWRSDLAVADAVAQFGGLRVLAIEICTNLDGVCEAFARVWPQLVRLEYLNLTVVGDRASERTVAPAVEWLLPNLVRLVLSSDSHEARRFPAVRAPRLQHLYSTCAWDSDTFSRILESCAATLQSLDQRPASGLYVGMHMGPQLLGGAAFEALRSLRVHSCPVDGLWARAAQLPRLSRLSVTHARGHTDASSIACFMEETAARLEFFAMVNSRVLVMSDVALEEKCALPKPRVVMRALECLQVSAEFLRHISSAFVFPALALVETDAPGCACACTPRVTWAGCAPALAACRPGCSTHHGARKTTLTMTRVRSVPLTSLAGSVEWTDADYTCALGVSDPDSRDGHPDDHACTSLGVLHVFMCGGDTVGVWHTELIRDRCFLSPGDKPLALPGDGRSSSSSSSSSKTDAVSRVGGEIVHLLVDSGVRIAAEAPPYPNVPTAHALDRLNREYADRHRIPDLAENLDLYIL